MHPGGVAGKTMIFYGLGSNDAMNVKTPMRCDLLKCGHESQTNEKL